MSKQTDFIEKARDFLTLHGLVVDVINCSGGNERCGTTEAPKSRNGWYRFHLDDSPVVTCINYNDGKGGEKHTLKLYDVEEWKKLTESEKEERREAFRQRQAKDLAELAVKRKRAANKAEWYLRFFPHAGEDNGYLKRKGVLPFGELKQMPKGQLVVPMYDASGKVVSVQTILPEKPNGEGKTDKFFLKDGEVDGCYFPIPAHEGHESGPLLIAEGYATAASLRMATGFKVWAAFNAGNLEPVARIARGKYPAREILLCADNDCTDKKGNPRPEEKNTGVVCATKAAQTIGAKLAVCPAINGRKADFNDLHAATDDGIERVRVCIEKARAEAEQPSFPAGYFVRESGPKAGLYKLEEVGEDVKEYRLGPPLRVLGRTRDENSKNWGILLEWKDPAGVQHRVALPDELRQKQGRDWASMLAADGYSVEPGQHPRFLSFLSGVKTARFITNTSKVGWYQTCFVLPDVSIGAEDGLVVLQSLDSMAGLYQTGGTLEGWQEMAALCVGNPRFTFALCAAFAGPLLKLAGMEGGGFSFEGPSSCGKTTCLQVAASVWGSPAHVRTWRTTSNGLESVAALHNDSLLVLDEVGQTTGKDLSEISYMLANGSGKTRAGRSGGARACTSWRLLFLSSGELGFADKLGEDGIRSRAGQEVRFVGIPVDSRAVVNLHSIPHAGALVNRIKELSGKDYGHASRAFLGWLVRNLGEVRELLPETLPAFVADLCPDEAGEQVRRVAQRFAIVQIAGGLAQKAGVLPVDMDVTGAVRSCFSAWLEQRGSVGASEDEAILAAVRLFLEQHGQSRFQDIERPDAVCVNRAGFRRKDGERTEFLILPESFKEVVQGYALKRAKEALRIAEWMKPGERGKFTVKTSLPGLGRTHCYIVAIPDED